MTARSGDALLHVSFEMSPSAEFGRLNFSIQGSPPARLDRCAEQEEIVPVLFAWRP
jgi:hypothetical protein